MNNAFKTLGLAALIWILTSLVFGFGWFLYSVFFNNGNDAWISLLAIFCAALGSLPVLLVLTIALTLIRKLSVHKTHKIGWLAITCLVATVPYGLIGGHFLTDFFQRSNYEQQYILRSITGSVILFSCSIIAMLIVSKRVNQFFSSYPHHIYQSPQIKQKMETEQPAYALPESKTHSNKTFIKGIITGSLILVMMIPTLFVTSLVTEREQRQAEVVKEVSSKWASEQTIAGPYIFIPYNVYEIDKDKKPVLVTKHLLLLPDNLDVAGTISPEIRPRSIYKVLLYKSSLNSKGNFTIHVPKEINSGSLQLQDAKICFGITDFKGIEEKVAINFNAVNYELSPGLPVNDVDANGLSAPINLSIADIGKSIDFNMQLKMKGSEQLHFIPLSGNSSFALQSTWSNPSFDGNNLPGERTVNQNGFTAKWTINKANLPFGTILQTPEFNKSSFAFGVSMLQPADQYAKTMRSVKYAILFIGLTFSLFFIVELMQKKPLHPVQYVLVGLALVIFYTLLLSLSEFILFDQAYGVAALATILLITLYSKSHFESWKTAALFGAVLGGLYGFIFILIRLEDTALLVGSIGLFLVLALVMYGSRKINWYNTTTVNNGLASA